MIFDGDFEVTYEDSLPTETVSPATIIAASRHGEVNYEGAPDTDIVEAHGLPPNSSEDEEHPPLPSDSPWGAIILIVALAVGTIVVAALIVGRT